jgi:hypothetical protein
MKIPKDEPEILGEFVEYFVYDALKYLGTDFENLISGFGDLVPMIEIP